MTPMFKARYSIFYSLLFVSIVCESFAAFGNNLKNTEPGNLQIAERDNPREVLKKALSASQGVKSYRVRVEVPSISKVVTIMEYALPDRVRIFEKNEVTLWIGKNIYRKEGRLWKKYPDKISDMWGKEPEKKGDPTVAFPAIVLENLIKDLARTEDIKFIGQETVDGIPTLAYQQTMRSNTGTYPMKTWIGVADGLLRRWEFECGLWNSTPLLIIYTYYDYNADIKIEPPTEAELLPIGIPGPPSLGPGSGGMGVGDGGRVGLGSGTNPNARWTKVDSKPKLLNLPRPNYTEEARKNKIEGVVMLRVLISSDGLVKQVKVVRGLPDGLNEEAIRAAYLLRFNPAMKYGQPVASWQPVEIEFNLGNDRIR
jgi:TonB family protein